MNQKIIYVIKNGDKFICDKSPFVCSDVNDASHYNNAMLAEIDINSAKKHMSEANTYYQNNDERDRAVACVGGEVKKYIRTITYCEVNS